MKWKICLFLLLSCLLFGCGKKENVPQGQGGIRAYPSLEAFLEQEKAVPALYLPENLPAGFSLKEITLREGQYVMAEYTDGEKCENYDSERLHSLLCKISLSPEEASSREGYTEISLDGNPLFYGEEYRENDPRKGIIGYECVFSEEGYSVFVHLPAIESFETMSSYLKLEKISK